MRNGNAIYLDKNENHYGPSPKVIEALHSAKIKDLATYERDTNCLTKKLAEMYDMKTEQIILGYGAEDILKTAMERAANPHDKVMIPKYSWWYYKALADHQDVKVIYAPIEKDNGVYYYDLENILAKIKQEWPRLILIAHPNNPTGNWLEYEEVIDILNVSGDALVVLDLAYAGFSDEKEDKYIKLVDKYPNLMVIFTFSKLYAMSGVRVGYAFIGDNVRDKLRYNERLLGFNKLSAKLAIAALESQDYYSDIAKKMIKDREMLYNELGQFPIYKPYKSRANFLLVEVDPDYIAPLQQALQNHNIVIKFFKEKHFPNTIRISIGTESENALLLSIMKEVATKKHVQKLPTM